MNIEIVNVVQSDEAPTRIYEDPVFVEFDLTRRTGGELSEDALESGMFDESLLALKAGDKVVGSGWTEISLWLSLSQEFQDEFATVLEGTITCTSMRERVVFRDGRAILVEGKTVYPEGGEMLCPFCQGPTKFVNGGHIEAGAYDGKHYAVDTDVTGNLCQDEACGAWFFTGVTDEDLATITKEG